MKYKIADYPSSYLTVEFDENDKLITEKGVFIYADGEYSFENKIEAKGYKNWIAKFFGGKSLTYNIYSAEKNVKMAFSTKDNAEIFNIDVSEDNPIIFEPEIHFARTYGLEVKLVKKDLKSTLNDGIKVKTYGSGTLFLKGYGNIIKQEIDTETPVFIDETALIAYEDTLDVKTISKGFKDFLLSGEGFLFSIKGKGTIWIQTREKGQYSSSGGIIEGIFSFLK